MHKSFVIYIHESPFRIKTQCFTLYGKYHAIVARARVRVRARSRARAFACARVRVRARSRARAFACARASVRARARSRARARARARVRARARARGGRNGEGDSMRQLNQRSRSVIATSRYSYIISRYSYSLSFAGKIVPFYSVALLNVTIMLHLKTMLPDCNIHLTKHTPTQAFRGW